MKLIFFVLLVSAKSLIAQAGPLCEPSTLKTETTNISCGSSRLSVFAKKSVKIKMIKLLVEDLKNGQEQFLEIQNPGLNFQEANTNPEKSKKVVAQIDLIKKSWKSQSIRVTVKSFELEDNAVLYTNASLKEKIPLEKIKVIRNVASNPPSVGGVRAVPEKK